MKKARRIIALTALVSTLAAAIPAGAQSDAVAAATPAGTQPESVARLKEVIGNVLVSQPTGLAAGVPSQRLAKGTRIITTANSEALVAFDNGCEVRMRENQRFEVEDKSCEELVAVDFGGTLQAAAGVGLIGLLVPSAAVVGGVAAIVTPSPTPVSPN